jgi:hypothetical protein
MQVKRLVAEGKMTPREWMIANVLAFNSSPQGSPAAYNNAYKGSQGVMAYNAHFSLGEYDERRLAMPSATNLKYGKRPSATNLKYGKRPRGG